MNSSVYLLLVLLTTGAASSDCKHEWQTHFSECPFGRSILSVTLPDPGKAAKKWRLLYQNNVTHPLPALYAVDAADLNQDWLLFVIYGYVPYVVVFLAFLPMLRGSTGTRELSFVLFAVLVFVVTEIALKSIAKQPRPERSCVTSCGMPSGHSSLAMGYWTCLIMDLSFRVYPTPLKPEEKSEIIRVCEGCILSSRKFWVACPKICFWNFLTFTPLAATPDISHIEFLLASFIWSLVLLPVPLSRIGTYDHSPMQVMVGCLVGVGCGSAWAAMTRRLQRRFFAHTNHEFSWRFFKIRHNYSLPFFVAEDLLKDALEGDDPWDDETVQLLRKFYCSEPDDSETRGSGGEETSVSEMQRDPSDSVSLDTLPSPQTTAHVIFVVEDSPFEKLYLAGSIKELGGSLAISEKEEGIKLSFQQGKKLKYTIKSKSVQVVLPVKDIKLRLYREKGRHGIASAWNGHTPIELSLTHKTVSSFLKKNQHEVYLKVTMMFEDKMKQGARVESDPESDPGEQQMV